MAGKKHRKQTDMRLLTPAQQAERIERVQYRKKIRQANLILATLVLSWVVGRETSEEEFMEQFNARGHEGQYHETPSMTTLKRVQQQTAELPNLAKRLSDTPLDYMGAVELRYVYQRIMMMIEALKQIPSGPVEQALALYQDIGEKIRIKILTGMGHYPEHFPIPRDRITGKESERQFKPTEYQTPLFEEE